MLPFVIRAKRAVRNTARKAAFAVIAGVAGLVALGFFTGAGYLWLQDKWGAVAAASAIGGIYLVIAGIAGAMASSDAPPEPEPVPPAQIWSSLAEGFLIGLSATRKKR